jgi:hypothetical protein
MIGREVSGVLFPFLIFIITQSVIINPSFYEQRRHPKGDGSWKWVPDDDDGWRWWGLDDSGNTLGR